MDYSSMAVNYARRQRQSPVLSSGISKQTMHKSSSPLSKRWSMYDGSVFAAAAAMNYVDAPVRMRPASMIMTTSMPVASYMAPAPMAMASPYMPATSDGTVFSPSLAMQQQQQQNQQQQAMYSPVFSSPAYYAAQSFAMMPAAAAQQQPMAYAAYADYPPTLPESVPSAFDMVSLSTPDFDLDASAHSPKFTAPLTPVQDTAMSAPAARPAEAVVDDEEEGEILHGMGLYDKFDAADLSLDSSRDSMQSLLQDTTRAAMPTKMLLLENFEPEMTKDDDEEEEEEEAAEETVEEVVEQQQQQQQQQQQAPAVVPAVMQQVQLMDMTPTFYHPLYAAQQAMVFAQPMTWI